jgi:hypothetical protein
VAFSWNGEKQDNFDIYLKLIGSPTPERLTTDPAEDVSPAFSPDGRSIGFVRVSKGRASFIIIPSIGGPERVVAEVPTAGKAGRGRKRLCGRFCARKLTKDCNFLGCNLTPSRVGESVQSFSYSCGFV